MMVTNPYCGLSLGNKEGPSSTDINDNMDYLDNTVLSKRSQRKGRTE
jgi:hypothetical protein